MKKVCMAFSSLLFCCFLLLHSQAQSSADDIIGKWRNPNGKVTVEITKDKEHYTGKVVESSAPKVKAGDLFFTDLTFQTGDNHWRGRIKAPERPSTLPCTLTVNGKGSLFIKVSASFQSKTLEWKKVQ